MKLKKTILRTFLIIVCLGIILLGIPTLIAEKYARTRTFSVESVSPAPVAIVFGAGLTRSGAPTPILRDRVATAARLYFEGKVQKILMSGDNRFVDYNEPGAMQEYALQLGVPEDAIVLDYAGRRTYDTCYRARHIFNLTEAILVTQDFHLPRAILTCNGLGIQANGVNAVGHTYSTRSLSYWRMREIPATAQAILDVFVTRPLPVLGKPEPIFPYSVGLTSPNF